MAWRGWRLAAVALAGIALAHFIVFTGLLHNPLWTEQAVGPVPLFNWILAASIVGIAATLSLRRWLPDRVHVAFDALAMAIVALGALGLLRQGFAGSVPALEPLGQGEDLARSLLGIAIALVFLAIGTRTGLRSWRVGSLVVMLVAVLKVFILDAAGLEGLLRVASFMALGFSLIGIGWLYARLLRSAPSAEPEAEAA